MTDCEIERDRIRPYFEQISEERNEAIIKLSSSLNLKKIYRFEVVTIRRYIAYTIYLEQQRGIALKHRSQISILSVPNLQGEHFPFEVENCPQYWVAIEDSLPDQVECLLREYNNHPLLIGSSFGGLAAWTFSSEQCPNDLKGLVLIDVLPSLNYFPRWRLLGVHLTPLLPKRLTQSIYNKYRLVCGQSNDHNLEKIFRRIHSIIEKFPEQEFPIPTLVLSSKKRFHKEWLRLSNSHKQLSAQRSNNPSKQITEWLQIKCILHKD